MPYETLKGSGRPTQTSLVSKEPAQNDWRQHYWRLLMDKCCLALVTLAGREGKNGGIGSLPSALSHLNMAARLWELMDVPPYQLKNCAFALAGDLYFSAVQQWNDELATTEPSEPSDPALQQLTRLLDSLELEKKKSGEERKETIRFPVPASLQEALQSSLDNYRLAVISFSTQPERGSKEEGTSLAKRLGNVCNEMGVFFMSKAASKCPSSFLFNGTFK